MFYLPFLCYLVMCSVHVVCIWLHVVYRVHLDSVSRYWRCEHLTFRRQGPSHWKSKKECGLSSVKVNSWYNLAGERASVLPRGPQKSKSCPGIIPPHPP